MDGISLSKVLALLPHLQDIGMVEIPFGVELTLDFQGELPVLKLSRAVDGEHNARTFVSEEYHLFPMGDGFVTEFEPVKNPRTLREIVKEIIETI